MKILLRIAVIAAVAALAAGCCKCRSYQKKNRRPLIGTEWQLIQLDGRAVKPEEGKFYVMFLAEENRFAGVGACNRLMGKYETTDKGALRIGPIASTMIRRLFGPLVRNPTGTSTRSTIRVTIGRWVMLSAFSPRSI